MTTTRFLGGFCSTGIQKEPLAKLLATSQDSVYYTAIQQSSRESAEMKFGQEGTFSAWCREQVSQGRTYFSCIRW